MGIEGIDPLQLYGHNDANLVAFEKRYGVHLVARGESIVVEGEAGQVEQACRVLSNIVSHLRQGREIDLNAFLRSGRDVAEEVASGSDAAPVLLSTRKSLIRPRSTGQQRYVTAVEQQDIVFCIGPAGTGKTYLAVAKAVDALYKKRVKRIILARPAVEAGENLGFLPGDLQEKVDPYLRPLYDALEDMMPVERVRRALEDRTIEIAPLAYMRGRTLSDAFVILDEAQNATTAQMKMFLTRLGLNSRVVITGDKTQIDLPRKQDSGLLQVEQILKDIDGISILYLDAIDVIRHRLVKDIIRAYTELGTDADST